MICAAESAEALGQGGKFTVEWVATFAWNQWQFCRGMGGNFCVESVASLPWNRWQLCHGISGNFRVEYALRVYIEIAGGGCLLIEVNN